MTKPTFKPSPRQEAIYHWGRTKLGCAIVVAVAGSGKTTTIIQLASLFPRSKRMLFIAFNKDIVVELGSGLPDGCMARTFNSIGFWGWRKWLDARRTRRGKGKAQFALDEKKCSAILTKFSDQFDPLFLDENWEQINKLVSLGKSYGICPASIKAGRTLLLDMDESWQELIDKHDLDVAPRDTREVLRATRMVLDQSLREPEWIDYDDQLYMPVVYQCRMPQFDVVLVDEAQDASPVNRALLHMLLKPEGRLIAVGDPYQSIYGFRGADTGSMRKIKQEFKAVELPLDVSYRCPQNVVAYAQQLVPIIKPAETAAWGSVTSLPWYIPTDFKPGDSVVCRLTAPLVILAYRLIGNGVKAMLKGRDIAGGLVKIIEKLKPNGIEGDNGLYAKLEEWEEKERLKWIEKDREDRAQTVTDKAKTIRAFIEGCGQRTVPKLIAAMNALFSDNENPDVMLSTIHRAKGLEADRVFILDDALMPSPYAKQDWQREQELNLAYVAYTRPKKELIFIRSDDFRATERKLCA